MTTTYLDTIFYPDWVADMEPEGFAPGWYVLCDRETDGIGDFGLIVAGPFGSETEARLRAAAEQRHAVP